MVKQVEMHLKPASGDEMMKSRAAKDPSVFTMTEKAPSIAFSWLKALALNKENRSEQGPSP